MWQMLPDLGPIPVVPLRIYSESQYPRMQLEIGPKKLDSRGRC